MNLPALATRGNRIVRRQHGTPVLLRGVNRSGMEYGGPPVTTDELDTICRGWGANIVRLPFTQEWALTREEYLRTIDQVIAWNAQRGAYTLLDLQWLSADRVYGYRNDGSPNRIAPLPDFETPRLWRLLAERYRGNPAVLFDLYNEPHDVDARTWRHWARLLHDTVREVNPDTLVFVSGIDWGYDLRGVPFEGGNIVYATHVYRVKRTPWRKAFAWLAATAPVFAAEWGGGDGDLEWGRELAALFRELAMGWTAWSWCDHPHLQRNGEATAFGEIVRAELAW